MTIKVTESYPVEFVSHVSYSLLLTGIHVIAPLWRLATKRPDCLFCLPPQVQESVVFTYRSPHFCFPWRRPCDYHAICCMDEKTIQCLPNPSQHVPTYLQQFPSYSNRKCQNRRFHVPQPTFLFPLETPLQLSHNMLHGWKDNSMFAKSLAACTYLSSIVSELYDA